MDTELRKKEKMIFKKRHQPNEQLSLEKCEKAYRRMKKEETIYCRNYIVMQQNGFQKLC